MAGIPVASSFQRMANLALDNDFIKADTTARDAIPSGIRYQGQLCYVVANSKMYQLQGGIANADWAEAGGGNDATKANLAGGNAFTGTQTFANDLILSAYLKRSYSSSVSAAAGGGSISATALAADVNKITTCATAGDSVKLPPGVAGMSVFVHNDGVASCNVFPSGSEFINALGASTALPVLPGNNVLFFCVATGQWKSIAGSSPLTTKGDLFTYGTQPTRLAVGADGKILKANSAAATGLEWGDAPVANVIRAGVASIAASATTVSITFATVGTTDYSLVCFFECSDADPIFLQGLVSTSTKSATGCTVKLSAPTDSANYKLNWQVIVSA